MAGCWGVPLYGCIVAHNVGIGAFYGNQSNCLYYGNDIGVYLQDGKLLDAGTIVGNRIGVMIEGDRKATILNSIIYSNTANWSQLDTCVIAFTNMCTTPSNSVAWATGNITNNPLLVDFGSGYGTNHVVGNYRLQANSPCVNAGLNQTWMDGALDMDNHSRIDRFSGMVDMGCYEHLPRGMMFKVH